MDTLSWIVVGVNGDAKGMAIRPGAMSAATVAELLACCASMRAPASAPPPTPVPAPAPQRPPASTPAPAPPVRPVQRYIGGAPSDRTRTRISFPAGQPAALRDVHVEGFGQNIVVQNVPRFDGSNIRTVRAYSDAQYEGQGMYVGNVPDFTLSGYYSRLNGWQPDKPLWQNSWFKHGLYLNFGTKNATIDTAIIVDEPEAAIMLRLSGGVNAGAAAGKGTIRRAVLINCGVGISAIMGDITLDEVTIYDGAFCVAAGAGGHTASGTWVNNIGVMAWCPLSMNDVWIVGRPGQETPAQPPPPTQKMKPVAINTSKVWSGKGQPDHQAYQESRPNWTLRAASKCVIAGWGDACGGDNPGAVAPVQSGIRSVSNPADFDYAPILANIEANAISLDDAYTQLRDGIRNACRAANPALG